MSTVKPTYDYSLLRVDYSNKLPINSDYIRIICSLHGEFKVPYRAHKEGYGKCPSCQNNWTLLNCKTDALKYNTRTEWCKNSSGAYDAAYRNGWLDECCKHMTSKTMLHGYWTFEKCHEEALLCTEKNEWRKKYKKSYDAARRNGWIEKCSTHMKSGRKKPAYWTKDKCIIDAKKYKTKKEWAIKSGSAYNTARKYGWLKECCKHMISGRINRKWTTIEKCIESTKNIETSSLWLKKYRGAYDAAERMGWLTKIYNLKNW